LLFSFGNEEPLHLKDGHAGKRQIREKDDCPAVNLTDLALQADHIAIVEQDDGRDNGRKRMPVSGQFNALFPGRPDAEDFIQADSHKDANTAGGEIHVQHLPCRAKLEGVAHQGRQLLKEVGLLQMSSAIADQFTPTPDQQ